jgi:hypothetical protein
MNFSELCQIAELQQLAYPCTLIQPLSESFSPSQNYHRLQKPIRVPPHGHVLGLPDQFNWVATSAIGDC